MNDTVITVEHISKSYRIGRRLERHPTLRDAIVLSFQNWRTRRTPSKENDIIWALQDVSCTIERGQVVGIIGRNGAGKSTLLKILSRITVPTDGYAELYGRSGTLLEVGTGFHPELTGRENIYLSGAILGMRRIEIDRKFDEIVAFAEISKFIDTPVKRYSSGMYVRLGFAVAAHLETEILLVDEVLAVGDAAFQRKCLGKMDDLSKQGRTVLFVSHNLQAVSTLTTRTIVLEAGRVFYDGEPADALARYRRLWEHTISGEYGNPSARNGIRRAVVTTSEPNQFHRFGKPLTIEFEIHFEKKPKAGGFSFQIVDEQSRPITDLWLFNAEYEWATIENGSVTLRCELPHPRLYMGRYYLKTALTDRVNHENYETLEGICPFEVVMDGMAREYKWKPGTSTYLEDANWSVSYNGVSEYKNGALEIPTLSL